MQAIDSFRNSEIIRRCANSDIDMFRWTPIYDLLRQRQEVAKIYYNEPDNKDAAQLFEWCNVCIKTALNIQ